MIEDNLQGAIIFWDKFDYDLYLNILKNEPKSKLNFWDNFNGKLYFNILLNRLKK